MIETTPFYTYLQDKQGWQAPVALVASGALVFFAALVIRVLLFIAFRTSGQVRYTAVWQRIEDTATVIMFIVGSVGGYFVWGNIASALLSGGCWGFVTIGTVLQALTANEKNRK